MAIEYFEVVLTGDQNNLSNVHNLVYRKIPWTAEFNERVNSISICH